MSIKEQESFNVSKQAEAKVVRSLAEKERAIVDALRHFGIVE